MTLMRRSTVSRTVAATAAAAIGWAGLEYVLARATSSQWHLVTTPGPASLDEALTLVVAAVAVALCTWLGASTLAALLTHFPGRVGRLAEQAAAWVPPVTRRMAAVLVGATVTGALVPGTALGEATPAALPAAMAAAPGAPAPADGWEGRPGFAPPAFAAGGAAGPGWRAPGSDAPALDGPAFVPTEPSTAHAGAGQGADTTPDAGPVAPGWVPTRPLQRPQPSAALVVAGRPQRGAVEVVVHRGDTLWDIVVRQLGPQATDAEVATAWPRWFAANRDVIGGNPDLVKPGQVLRSPGADVAATR
jgi:hypothetical protein